MEITQEIQDTDMSETTFDEKMLRSLNKSIHDDDLDYVMLSKKYDIWLEKNKEHLDVLYNILKFKYLNKSRKQFQFLIYKLSI
jgi:hypothetical protein